MVIVIKWTIRWNRKIPPVTWGVKEHTALDWLTWHKVPPRLDGW
jgi:hypothetical protein